jgi:hypothetical protein
MKEKYNWKNINVSTAREKNRLLLLLLFLPSVEIFFLFVISWSRELSPCSMNNILNQCRVWGTKTRKYILRPSLYLFASLFFFFSSSLLSFRSSNLMHLSSHSVLHTHTWHYCRGSVSICILDWFQLWTKCRKMIQVK